MQCENTISDVLAYFTQAIRKNVPCRGEAKWIVTVNPPRDGNDGKVRLCDFCNRWDYLTFPRQSLAHADESGSAS
jgi:hypothetical protein